MTKYLSHLSPDRVEERSLHYSLFAVICHSGSLSGGHYWAYCKGLDGSWCNYNDSSVSSIGPDFVTGAAYILLYERIN
jgi:ubiquitin C-terminal hydrolase